MKEKFSEEELNILKDTIIKLFYSVALADGKIDNEEWNLFSNTIRNYEEVENKLLSDLIQNIDFSSPINNNRIKNLDLNNVLNQANEILNKKLNENETKEFKLYLVSFLFKIAESSKHFFSNDVTKEERKVINDIISFLNLVEYDINYIKSIKDKLPNIIYENLLSKALNFTKETVDNLRRTVVFAAANVWIKSTGTKQDAKFLQGIADSFEKSGIEGSANTMDAKQMKEMFEYLRKEIKSKNIKNFKELILKIEEIVGFKIA